LRGISTADIFISSFKQIVNSSAVSRAAHGSSEWRSYQIAKFEKAKGNRQQAIGNLSDLCDLSGKKKAVNG
jgi:hypothetical protein